MVSAAELSTSRRPSFRTIQGFVPSRRLSGFLPSRFLFRESFPSSEKLLLLPVYKSLETNMFRISTLGRPVAPYWSQRRLLGGVNAARVSCIARGRFQDLSPIEG